MRKKSKKKGKKRKKKGEKRRAPTICIVWLRHCVCVRS